jgi:hypothetical protein
MKGRDDVRKAEQAMLKKFPWKIFMLYCLLVLVGGSLFGMIGKTEDPVQRALRTDYGLGAAQYFFHPAVIMIALTALTLTMFHDFIRNRMRKKNQQPP